MSSRLSVTVSTLVVAAGVCLQPGFGQGRGAQPTPPSGGGSTGAGSTTGPGGATTGRPSVPSIPSQTPGQQPQQQPQMQQPIFISGRVLLEDGTAPTQSVVIERVCNGQPHSEGYTDSKGYFALTLGQRNPGVMIDASEDAGMGGFGGAMPAGGGFGNQSSGMRTMGNDMRFANCELRARLAGYRSQMVSLAMRRPMDNPDVGVILLHRLGGNEEGATISATSLNAPKDARKSYEKGLEAIKKKKFEDAEKAFTKSVEIYPKYAAAWCELGRLQAGRNDAEGARKSFNAAMQADSKFVQPYVELSILDARAQNWQALADSTAAAIRLDPFDYPQAYFFNAVANYNLKNWDAAEKSAREAERLDTRHQFPKNTHLLGVLLANKQDYTGAAEKFKSYLKMAPTSPDAEQVKSQLEKMEQISAGAKPQQ